MRRILDTDDITKKAGLAIHLAELVEALDDWLTRGGFLPEEWGVGRVEVERAAQEATMDEAEDLHDQV